MSVRLTETAFADIREIYAYIAKDNPVVAAAVAAAIERTIAAIEKRPTLAPIVHDGKVRAKIGRTISISHFLRGRRSSRDHQKRSKYETPAALGELTM